MNLLLISSITLLVLAFKLSERFFLPKHKVLRVIRRSGTKRGGACIIASLGATTAGVFIIQILPLIFSVIGDIAGPFSMNIVYADRMGASSASDFTGEFYGLMAQLGDMLQTAAPLLAVGLGGYNLLNNLSKGLPAIFHD